MAEKNIIPRNEKLRIRAEAAASGQKLIDPKDPANLKSYLPTKDDDDKLYRGLYTHLILPRVEEMARLGYTMKEMCKVLGISPSTFWEWREKHPELSHSLKKYRGLADIQVENALFKSAVGFNFTEIKKERRKLPDGTYQLIETEHITKHIPGVPAAQIFYLKNRMPDRYKDKVDVVHGISDDISQMAFAIKRRGE